MGVDYSAVLAVGKEFYEKEGAKDFVRSNSNLSEDELEDMDCNFHDWLDCEDIGGCLNYYSGDHFYIGFIIRCSSPEAFKESFEQAVKNWQERFPNANYDIIHTVKVH